MRYLIWLALLAFGIAAGSGAARAEWREASSAHFVIYANDDEKDIRRFSEQLERYHAALNLITGVNAAPPSPSNRVTVFAVRNEAEVRALHGPGSRFVSGFYIPRAGSSVAIVPRIDVSKGTDIELPMIVLLHEYAHHFMISNSSYPMPRWISEGSAEFFASAGFEADGGVLLGRPAQHRGAELVLARNVKAADLLDPAAYEARAGKAFDAFYGKSWLLYHYLTFEPARQGQLRRYILQMNGGKSSRDAGLATFGDFGVLEKELDKYMHRGRMHQIRLSSDKLRIGPVAVRTLRAGEAAMIPVRMRSKIGVDEEAAAKLVTQARAVAQRFPGDPAVNAALAEAEYDAGNDDAAIAAADAALAADKGQVNAYVQKGYALFRKAAAADKPGPLYAAGRAVFVELNRLETDHPLPLVYFFRSYADQGRKPTELAVQGLARATELAPFDRTLRMNLALFQLRDGKRDLARANFTVLSLDPHGDGSANAARLVLERMDSDPAWDGQGPIADELAKQVAN